MSPDRALKRFRVRLDHAGGSQFVEVEAAGPFEANCLALDRHPGAFSAESVAEVPADEPGNLRRQAS